MITLTKEAVIQLKQFSQDEAIGHLNIRIKVIGGGCAGLSHDMIFDDLPPTSLDEIIIQDDITMYIDCLSLSYMKDITLDYLATKYGAGFKFIGGEDTKSCGCGNSFTP